MGLKLSNVLFEGALLCQDYNKVESEFKNDIGIFSNLPNIFLFVLNVFFSFCVGHGPLFIFNKK